MPFPEGIPTRQVSIGKAFILEEGTPLRLRVTVAASRSLVRDVSGDRFEARGVSQVVNAGQPVLLELPVTDAPGWRDAATQNLIDVETVPDSFTHTYTARVEVLRESTVLGRPFNLGPFLVPTGEGALDLDKSLQVATVPGEQVAIPDTWSAIVAEAFALAEGITQDLIDARQFVAGEVAEAVEEEDIPGQVAGALADVPEVAAAAAALAQTDAGLVQTTDFRLPRFVDMETLVRAFADAEGRVALGIRSTGGVTAPLLDGYSLLYQFAEFAHLNGWELSSTPPSVTGYVRAWADSQGRVALGIRDDGSVVAPLLQIDSSFTRTVVAPEPAHSTKKGLWRADLALYNYHSRNTMKWRSAWARARSGLGVAHISTGLDSITMGQGGVPHLHSWPKRTWAMLRDIAGRDAGTGMTPLWNAIMASPSLDTRWSSGGPWTPYTTLQNSYGLPTGQGYGVMGISCARVEGGGWWQFAPEMPVAMMTAYLAIAPDSTGIIDISIDGTVHGTVNAATGAITTTGAAVGTKITLRSGTPANTMIVDVDVADGYTHNIRLTGQSGAIFYLVAMEGRNLSGVKVSNLARSSTNLQNHWLLDDPNNRYGLPWEVDVPKSDLQILMPIMNNRSSSPSTVKGYVRTAIQRQRAAGGDVLLIAPAQPDFANAVIGGTSAAYLALVAVLYELADEEDVPLIDLAWAWKDYATALSLGYFTDALHPNQLGAEEIADRVARVLAI